MIIAELNLPPEFEDLKLIGRAFKQLVRYHMNQYIGWTDAASRCDGCLLEAEAGLKGSRKSDILPLLSQATGYYIVVRRYALRSSSNIALARAYELRGRLRAIEYQLTHGT